MNYKRLCRALVCLLLVCCIMINCSPVRAEAAVGTATLVGVGAAAVIASGLIWLGVQPGSTPVAFNSIVNDAMDTLDVVSAGLVNVWRLSDGRYGIPVPFIFSLFSWIHEHSIVYPKLPSFDESSSDFASAVEFASTRPYAFIVTYYDGSQALCYSDYEVYAFGTSSIKTSDGNYHIYKWNGESWSSALKSIAVGSDATVQWFGTSCVSYGSDYDLTLGSIGVSGSVLEDAYADALENVVSIPASDAGTEEDVPVVPVAGGGTYEDTIAGTQEEVQTGAGVIDSSADVGADVEGGTATGTVTLPNWLSTALSTIVTALTGMKVSVDSIVEPIKGTFEAVISLPQTIGKAITDVLTWAFAISDTFIQTKVEALKAKYPYLDIFLGLGTNLKGFFMNLGTKPPIIYIDLGSATGSYLFGGKTVFVDLTWYAQYKGLMDSIIGAFIWLWLAWRVFLSIPGIIQGEAGTWGQKQNDIGMGTTAPPIIFTQKALPSGKRSRGSKE